MDETFDSSLDSLDYSMPDSSLDIQLDESDFDVSGGFDIGNYETAPEIGEFTIEPEISGELPHVEPVDSMDWDQLTELPSFEEHMETDIDTMMDNAPEPTAFDTPEEELALEPGDFDEPAEELDLNIDDLLNESGEELDLNVDDLLNEPEEELDTDLSEFFDEPTEELTLDSESFDGTENTIDDISTNIVDTEPDTVSTATTIEEGVEYGVQESDELADQVGGEEIVEGTEQIEQIDTQSVFEGLDSYDFDGIDVAKDPERLDGALSNFSDDIWENLSLDEQKGAMEDLATYVEDVIGFDNPPTIEYYNNPEVGDYGGYVAGTNTLRVNEFMLHENDEAADTVAHELWHAYQHQCAANPASVKGGMYQYGFDNYIRPEDDFTAYQDQLVESEARAFAQQIKDRLKHA